MIGFMVGHSGSFKSFAALYIAVAVATGRDAFGDGKLPVRQSGTVVMAAGEGQHGLVAQRIPAVERHLRIDLNKFPFFVVLALPPAASSSEVNKFIAEIKKAVVGCPPVRLVVLDTLNAMAGGMDENSATDMARVIDAAQHISKSLDDCFVLLIHHPPKSAKGADIDARGSSAIRAGADTLLLMVREKITGKYLTRLLVSKQKDGSDDLTIYLEGNTVDLGVNGDGDEITSLAFWSVPKETFDNHAKDGETLAYRIKAALHEMGIIQPKKTTSRELADAHTAARRPIRDPRSSRPREYAHAQLTVAANLTPAASFARSDGEPKNAPWKWAIPSVFEE